MCRAEIPYFPLSESRRSDIGFTRESCRAVSHTGVVWPLSVSVGSPEAVSVMRPADFNSGMPLLTVFALPTFIFNWIIGIPMPGGRLNDFIF